jgi:DNA-binding NarL/FixJ family response regulator
MCRARKTAKIRPKSIWTPQIVPYRLSQTMKGTDISKRKPKFTGRDRAIAAFVLYGQGYTTPEIAQQLGWSRGNAWRALTGRQYADVAGTFGTL